MSYYRVMLGPKSVYAEECRRGNFIGVDFDLRMDLTHHLPDDWREFNQQFIPTWLEANPDRSRIAAGLACGSVWTVAKGLKKGDTVLCPNGLGSYYVGEILDNYGYHPEGILPHRRTVRWHDTMIERTAMSEALRRSTGSAGTTSSISQYAHEIESLIGGEVQPVLITTDETVIDPVVFALEKHLEDFLVKNWKQTELGRLYDIYEENGELAGQQYPSDTGPIDILAISKDKRTLLVVELKKGRASDNVVGQIQRYMGYVLEELAEEDQTIRGVIIALEDDLRIRRALSVTTNIEFYRYQIDFKLYRN